MKTYKVIYKNGREEEKTEYEIRADFTELTSEFKQILFRLRFNEELFHNDTMTTFKRLS